MQFRNFRSNRNFLFQVRNRTCFAHRSRLRPKRRVAPPYRCCHRGEITSDATSQAFTMRAFRCAATLTRPSWTTWHSVWLSAFATAGTCRRHFSSAAAVLASHSADQPRTEHDIPRPLQTQLRDCQSVDGLLHILVSQHAQLNLLLYTTALRQLADMLSTAGSSTLTPRSSRHVIPHAGWQLLMSGLSERVSGLEPVELVCVVDYMRRLYAVLPVAEVGVQRVVEDFKEINVFGWYWRFATSERSSKHTSASGSTQLDSGTERSVVGAVESGFNRLLAALLTAIEEKFQRLSSEESALLLNSLSSLARLHPLLPNLLTVAHELTLAIERKLPTHPYSLRYLSLISTSLYRLHRVCYPLERVSHPLNGRKDVIRCPQHQLRFQLVMGMALTLTDVQKALLEATPRSMLHLSHVLEAVCVIAEDGAWDGLLEAVARVVIGRVSELSGHDISRLLLCFSRMQLNHDTLYHCLAERLRQYVERGEVDTEILVHSMFSLVWLKRQWSTPVDTLLVLIVERLGTRGGNGKLRRLSQQQQAMMAWSLAVVQLQSSLDLQPLLRHCIDCLPQHRTRPSAMTLVLLYELSLGLPAQLHALIPGKLLTAARQRYRAYRAAQPPVGSSVEGLFATEPHMPRGRFAYCLPWPDQLEHSNDALLWWVDDARYLQRYGARGEAISEVQWMRQQLEQRHIAMVEVGWKERRELKQTTGEQRIEWLRKRVAEAEAEVHNASVESEQVSH